MLRPRAKLIHRCLADTVVLTTAIDVIFILLCGAAAYIVAQTVLPGIGAQFIAPHTLFLVIFTLYALITLLMHRTDRARATTKRHGVAYGTAVAFFAGTVGIGSYYYGWIAGSILTLLCTGTMLLLLHIVTSRPQE